MTRWCFMLTKKLRVIFLKSSGVISTNMMLLLWILAASASHADVFDYPLSASDKRQTEFQKLTAQVRQQGEVAGEFVQQKQLQILAKPIVSSGRFQLSEQQFIWEIEQPFAIGYVFFDQTLVRNMDGEQQTIAPSAEPMLYGFFSFFFSLMNLSEQSLEQFFNVYYLPAEAADKSWQLGLLPKNKSIARSLKQLQVQGVGAQINQVELVEQGGDKTRLTFSYSSSAIDGQVNP